MAALSFFFFVSLVEHIRGNNDEPGIPGVSALAAKDHVCVTCFARGMRVKCMKAAVLMSVCVGKQWQQTHDLILSDHFRPCRQRGAPENTPAPIIPPEAVMGRVCVRAHAQEKCFMCQRASVSAFVSKRSGSCVYPCVMCSCRNTRGRGARHGGLVWSRASRNGATESPTAHLSLFT